MKKKFKLIKLIYPAIVFLFIMLAGSNIYLYKQIENQKKELAGQNEKITSLENQREELSNRITNVKNFNDDTWQGLLNTVQVLKEAIETYDNNAAVANKNMDIIDGQISDLYGKVNSLQTRVNAIVNYLTR